MQLNQYPATIGTMAHSVLQFDQTISEYREALNAMELEIELLVQFDPDLKNEAQRKARKAEALTTYAQYSIKTGLIARAQHDRGIAVINLEERRNEFTVLKLEARLKIAEAEAANF